MTWLFGHFSALDWKDLLFFISCRKEQVSKSCSLESGTEMRCRGNDGMWYFQFATLQPNPVKVKRIRIMSKLRHTVEPRSPGKPRHAGASRSTGEPSFMKEPRFRHREVQVS